MTINAYKHQHYDPKPDNAQFDAEGNPLPPKKTYDIDGNEIEPEEEELITESETTLTEVDCGFMMLFIGQFMLIGSFDDTGVAQAFFFATMQGCADQMTIVFPGCAGSSPLLPYCRTLTRTCPWSRRLPPPSPMRRPTIGCNCHSPLPLLVTLPCSEVRLI